MLPLSQSEFRGMPQKNDKQTVALTRLWAKPYRVEGRLLVILVAKHQFNHGKLTQKRRSLNCDENK